MKTFRYGLHFALLGVAAVVGWLVSTSGLILSLAQSPDKSFYLSFGFVGFLHSTALVLSLSMHKQVFRQIAFVVLATALSIAAPMSMIYVIGAFASGSLYLLLLLISASALGACSYWLLIEAFWFHSYRQIDLMKVVGLCIVATLTGWLFAQFLVDTDLPTILWWVTFSLCLYFSETRRTSQSPMLIAA